MCVKGYIFSNMIHLNRIFIQKKKLKFFEYISKFRTRQDKRVPEIRKLALFGDDIVLILSHPQIE